MICAECNAPILHENDDYCDTCGSLLFIQVEHHRYQEALKKIATHNSNNPIAIYLQNIAIKALEGE